METALSGRRVFVTGATGFIGRSLVARLVEAGAEVGVLSRSRSGLADLPKAVRPVIARLDDEARLVRALAGTAVLFNLAYDVRATAAANLSGFEGMLAAARSARVRRIVHLSSIVVYDAWPGADCTETGSAVRPGGSAYRQAKIAMERRLMAQPIPAAILQPTIVYGPGSALWTDGFAAALLAGGVVLPEPEGLCNGVFVEDVVQACLRAGALPDLGRERFVISGPSPFPWSALIEGYARVLGRGEVIHAPLAELRARLGPRKADDADRPPSAAARVSAMLRRLIGHRRFEALVGAVKGRVKAGARLEPDHHLLDEFTGTGICRIDHARTRLGYAPDYDLAAGLAATAAHLRRMAR